MIFKSAFKWTVDSCQGPCSQINSFRNSKVFSCFLKFCTLVRQRKLDFGLNILLHFFFN